MSDVPTIEITGGGYEGREGLTIENKDGRIVVTGWYDGGCELDIELNMPVNEFLQRLHLLNNAAQPLQAPEAAGSENR